MTVGKMTVYIGDWYKMIADDIYDKGDVCTQDGCRQDDWS